MRILFVHPDLGIGGAERLVVDAAIALQNKGHSVSFLTNHHNPNHCFDETINGTLKVETVGDWLPRSVFGKCSAFCAYFRMVYAALYTVFFLSKAHKIDVIFCDQISLGIPIFRLASNQPKVLFYCHFPDQLLSAKGSVLKHYYRMPLNFLEEKTTGQADGVLVNSKFTRRIFKETFKSLRMTPEVLYPSLNTVAFDDTTIDRKEILHQFSSENYVFLSVNRFERKKNIGLALKAVKALEKIVSKIEWERTVLVVAGGYDSRVEENVEHFDELVRLADELGISHKVTFLQSPSDKYKTWLMRHSEALLYTPQNEHFGIVPLESMYLRKPVIAVNSGGPTETIIHESTGFLCEQNENEFAEAMAKFIRDRTLSDCMGEMGHKRVRSTFSFEAFTEKLDRIVRELVVDSTKKVK